MTRILDHLYPDKVFLPGLDSTTEEFPLANAKIRGKSGT